MSTAKMVLAVLFVLVALGAVGSMDYEDAKRTERTGSNKGIRLLCVGFPIDASALRSPSKSARAAALVISNQAVDADDAVPTVLRCVVIED